MCRRTTWCALLMLLAAACSGAKGASSGSSSGAIRSGPSDGAEPTSSLVGPAGDTGAPAGGRGARGSASTTAPGGRSPAGGGRSSDPAGGARSPGGADTGARGDPGAYARTLLRPQPATRLAYEVLQQSSAGPRQSTLNHVSTVIGQASGKPVSVTGPVALPGGGRDYTADELRSLADTYGQAAQGGDQAVIRALFLHGTFQGNTSVLGVVARGDVLAVFEDQVMANANPLVRGSVLEDAVTMHETGHLLGLVDLVLHTGRQDPAHPGHSQDQASVMYWAVETNLVDQIFNGPPPRDFDDADRADFAALRAGA